MYFFSFFYSLIAKWKGLNFKGITKKLLAERIRVLRVFPGGYLRLDIDI